MDHHHAVLLYGENVQVALLPEQYKIPSVDVSHFVCERFSIDDARTVSEQASLTPFSGAFRVFIIVTRSIATEAQNALLKLFEEPPKHALFYIIAPKTILLLPTLRSRLHVVDDTKYDALLTSNESFASFLKVSYAERLEIIAQRAKEKDTQWIEHILIGSEHYAAAYKKPDPQLLSSILQSRNFIINKGASSKMLLEDLALALPLV